MSARGLTPLRDRGFRLLIAGQLASNIGDAFYAVALPWYVLATHGGALQLVGSSASVRPNTACKHPLSPRRSTFRLIGTLGSRDTGGSR
jgi:hypothetical protein